MRFNIMITLRIAVALLFCIGAAHVNAATREYWLAAEKVEWNYAPSGQNLIDPADGTRACGERHSSIRNIATFSIPMPPTPRRLNSPCGWAFSGRSCVPWKAIVSRCISATTPINRSASHVHGLQYDEENEGADMKGPGAAVPPNGTFTYHWEANSDAAPGPADPSSIVWLYHSHVDAVTEVYDGLIGTIVVTKKGMERSEADPSPADIDKAFTTLFLVFNENGREIVKSGQETEYESPEEEEEGEPQTRD